MTATWLLLLLVTLHFTSTSLIMGQYFPEDGESERVPLDDILQRAENIIIRSILRKIEEDEVNEDPGTAQGEWLSKRQHPGKRFQEDLEKRQHPGKRDDGEAMDYLEAQKRQHPGKRDEDDVYLDAEKRQHPGKRDDDNDSESYADIQKRPLLSRRPIWGQYSDNTGTQLAHLNEISKRQHPGKRYLLYNKRQHPGKRSWEEEQDQLQDLEKRQHPGKRYIDSDSLDYNSPCDIQDPVNCSKAGLLLEVLDKVNKGRADEKRQHPGRRFLWEGDMGDEE
ncbi:thyrotropin releasing hormone [Protopterus annectens]|uniref:thyrotropin releasing hormone n=1 Tax=Protopterus annectens TaxID=7888 RepID=UPI001CFA40E5|nr:thyrotropin releasing hormone [Protopterus annectens]